MYMKPIYMYMNLTLQSQLVRLILFRKWADIQQIFLTTRLRWAICLLMATLLSLPAMAQVDVTASSGNPSGTYTTLKVAFDSINSGYHGGIISIGISAGTTETVSAVLNASGSGAASYTSISIQPTGAAARTITGAIAGVLIDLNGADNVYINGLNTGGNALTISNTSTAATASTVRFIADASNNNIENCTLLGSGTSTTLGTVFFSTGTATGNDNNTIDSCVINGAGVNLPTNAVFCNGTTTTGIENSGNTISYSDIQNFFSAASVSSGILASAGSIGWTISNNKFFQTATRTYTTANTHKVISITGGGNHQVLNNTIGYSSNAATGTYAMTGTIATRLVGIHMSVDSASPSSIQGNTITAITLGTSSGAATANGIICGIQLSGGSVNVGTVTGNTIGASTGTGSIVATPTTTQGAVVGINSASTDIIKIQNNTIGSMASSGSSAAVAGGVFGITVSAVADSLIVTNNTIGNATTDNMRAGTAVTTTGSSIAAGVWLASTPTIAIVSDNTIQNITSYGTGTGGYVRGIFTSTTTSTTATFTINHNTVFNLATNAALTGVSNGICAALGIHLASAGGSTISNNTVHTISATGTGTTNVIAAGITHAASSVTVTGNSILGNTVYNILNAGTGTTAATPSTVSGICIRSGVGTLKVYNNMISLGTGVSANIAMIGIWANHGSTPNPDDSILYNTVNLNGTVTSGALSSFCFLRGDLGTTVRTPNTVVLNNIFTNNRTGGTGGHYAISNHFGVTTPSATGWPANASNYNVLNAAAGQIGHWTTAQTFSGWKTASAGDVSSYSGILVHYTDSSNDLHLNMGAASTALESSGLVVAGHTTDIDGHSRPGPAGSVNGGGLAPDFGADEFDGTPADILPPVSTSSPIPLSCSTADRTITVTITDVTGIPLTGSLIPRIYYRKGGSSTWFSQAGTYLSGTPQNGQYSFTILGADMGGLNNGDSTYYFVIAQDSSSNNNVGSSPSGVVATDVNNVTTPPSALSSFVVGTNLTGAYTINAASPTSGSNFQTFNAFSYALYTGCLTGPITVDVTAASGPYNEQITLPSVMGSSDINTISLNGNNDTLKFDPTTSARHVLKLDGIDYLTIRNLNIKGINATYDWGIHLTNAADHDSILNCRIDISANTSTTLDNSAALVAAASSTDLNAQGNNANHLVVKDCHLIGGYQTVILNGSSTGKITGNKLINDTIRDFYFEGIELIYNDSARIENNDIHRANRVSVTTFEGVEIGAGNTNMVVNANRIHDSHTSATTQTGTAYGIFSSACDAPLGSENLVTNNLIYNMNSGSGTIYALYNSGSDGMHYYNNTVVLDNAASTAGVARGLYQTTAANNIDIRNNIFYITRGGTGDKHCLYFGTTTSTITSNKNVLYMNSAAGTNGVGYYSSNHATLTDWKTVNSSAYDQQSFSINPTFALASPDFTPSAFVLNNAGDNVGVTTDINGLARTSTPDIGAFEFSPPAIDAELVWVSPTTPATTGLHTVTVNVLNNSAAATITDIELEYTDGTITQTETFTSLSIAALTSQQFSFTTQYNITANTILRAYIKNVNGVADGNQSNDTTATQNICLGFAGGTYTINSALPTGGGNYASFTDAIAAMSGCGILGPVVFNVDAASGPYTEQITIPAINNASATNTITFNGNGRTIQFTPLTAARHIIKLDGADYVKIDNLHIVGLATDFDWGVHFINGADYDSITNCVIDLSANTNTTQSNSGGIVGAGSTTTITTDGNANHLVIDGNTIIGGYQGIIINGVTGALNAVQNVITHNTIQDFYATGIELTDNDGALIQDNDIHRANRVTVTTFEGIEMGTGNKNVRVNRNKIHDTHTSASTQTGTAYGLYSPSDDAPTGQENIFSNNLIYNFNSLSGTQYAVYNTGSDGAHYYYNTITLDNAASTGGITRGIYQTTMAADVEIKNNIISITRGGTGAKNCLYFGTTTSTIASNNNLLYMNSPAGTVGVGYYSANQVTLADWKLVNSAAYDQQSISVDPGFNSAQNLRPNPVSPVLGAGAPLATVTTDFLGTTRSLTLPSIGAYEEGGDFIPPSFLVSAVSGTASTANRTLTGLATINDISGVDTTNHKPRIYYKKSTDNNTYTGNTSSDNGWKWTEATNTVNPFDFVIDYSILNGGSISGGDTLQYFIVAQDYSANHLVGLSRGSFTATPDSVDLTAAAFPITGLISSYRILATLSSGTYTVGNSGTYQNLTQVAALLNNNVIGGNVVFELQPDYDGVNTETFPISFDPISTTSPTNTVTIQPAPTVTLPLLTAGNPSGAALITLNGTVNVTFDGRPGGVGDTSNILWVIRNTRAAATFAPTFLFTNDAIKNTLQYLNIQSANSLATSGTIVLGTSNASFGNDSNMIRYNIIRDRSDSIGKPANAIYSDGTAGVLNSANVIEHNRIFNWTSSGVTVSATGNGGGWEMRENYLYMTDSAFAAQTGIKFSAGTGMNIISGNTIGGSDPFAGGTAWINAGNIAWRGIVCTSSTTDSTLIHNNIIQNINLTGGTGTYAGIELTGGLTSVRGNTIGHNTTPNSILTSQLGTIISIWVNNATNVTQIYDNLIANINSTGTTTAIGVNGIRVATLNTTTPLIVRNNIIHDMTAANPTTSTSTASLVGILCNNANTDQHVLNNTIYNLNNTSTAGATRVFGINASNASSEGEMRGNRIYNLNNASTVAAANITGIHLDLANNWTVENNMITLGTGVSNDIQITGIFDKSATSTNRYYYNSVLIEGNSAGSINTYGMWRTVATSDLDVKNNIFFNKRTAGGSGVNFATGSSTATLITTNTFNYNLLVVNDTNKVSEFPSGVSYGVHAYNYDLFTPNGTYNTNWIEATSALASSNLFIDPLNGDLGINTTNPESWYANAKGIPLAAYNGDFNNASGVRSTSIVAGPTDLGAMEFSTTTTPPSAVQQSSPANSSTTVYSFANRPVAIIDWGALGSVPSSLDVKFYSGDTAPALLPSASRFSYYTSIIPSGGSGYIYDIALLYDSIYLGTVSGSPNARTAQYNLVWEHLASSLVNPVSGLLSSNTASTLTYFGNFTGTDITNNPLPVTLTSFDAKRSGKNVWVYWTTASELNSDKFIVEASADSKNFRQIGTIAAAGNSSVSLNYQLRHLNAQADMNNVNVIYYRLVSVDKNGTSVRSKVVSVAFDKDGNTIDGTAAYPNPFNSAIILSIPSDAKAALTIEIMDINGRMVSQSTEQLTEGMNTINIVNLQDLEAGIYFVKASANGAQKVIKLVKN